MIKPYVIRGHLAYVRCLQFALWLRSPILLKFILYIGPWDPLIELPPLYYQSIALALFAVFFVFIPVALVLLVVHIVHLVRNR
jgi:hypothetical protein